MQSCVTVTPPRHPVPISCHSPFLCPLSAATNSLLLFSTDCTFLNISYRGAHTPFRGLSLSMFSEFIGVQGPGILGSVSHMSAGSSSGYYTSNPAKASGKAAGVGSNDWTPATDERPLQSSRLLASAWLNAGHCGHLRSEAAEESPLSFFL